MVVVAICAVLLAALRLPVLFVLLTALVVPLGGYAVNRRGAARGFAGPRWRGGS